MKMQIKKRADVKDIYVRIFQFERRFTMDWYDKDQLLQDVYKLRETIHMLSRKNEEIGNHCNDYYKKIDKLIDQLI